MLFLLTLLGVFVKYWHETLPKQEKQPVSFRKGRQAQRMEFRVASSRHSPVVYTQGVPTALI